MFNKDRLPELKMISDKMLKKYWSSPTCDNAMLYAELIVKTSPLHYNSKVEFSGIV